VVGSILTGTALGRLVAFCGLWCLDPCAGPACSDPQDRAACGAWARRNMSMYSKTYDEGRALMTMSQQSFVGVVGRALVLCRARLGTGIALAVVGVFVDRHSRRLTS